MNLNHRLGGDKKENGNSMFVKKVGRPLVLLTPLLLFILGLIANWQYFGSSWDTGSVSLVFVPIIGNLLMPILRGEDNLLLSTLVLIGVALGPAVFYTYIYYLTRRFLPSIVTGLMTLLPLSPLSSSLPERLLLAINDADGAHIVGLTLIPGIAIAYHLYMRTGVRKWQFITLALAVFLGLVSFFSFLILLVIMFFVSASEALVSLGRVKLTRFVATSTLLIISFAAIYNVSLVRMIASEAGKVSIAVVFNLLPMTFFLVPILGTFAFLLFDRRPQLQPLFLALAMTVTFGMLNWVRVTLVEITLFDQSRYAAEFSFTLAFLIGIVLTWLFDLLRQGTLLAKMPQLNKFREYLAYALVGTVVVALLGSLFLIPRSL